MGILDKDLAFNFPYMRRFQEQAVKAMEVAEETALEQEASMKRLRAAIGELPPEVDTRNMEAALDRCQGTMVQPIYHDTKVYLKNRIDQLIENISAIDKEAEMIFAELAQRSQLLMWQYQSLVQMLGKGSKELSLSEFQARLDQVMKLADTGDVSKYIWVADGEFQYHWSEIGKLLEKRKISDAENVALIEILKLLSTEEERSSDLYAKLYKCMETALPLTIEGEYFHLEAVMLELNRAASAGMLPMEAYERLEQQYQRYQLLRSMEQTRYISIENQEVTYHIEYLVEKMNQADISEDDIRDIMNTLDLMFGESSTKAAKMTEALLLQSYQSNVSSKDQWDDGSGAEALTNVYYRMSEEFKAIISTYCTRATELDGHHKNTERIRQYANYLDELCKTNSIIRISIPLGDSIGELKMKLKWKQLGDFTYGETRFWSEKETEPDGNITTCFAGLGNGEFLTVNQDLRKLISMKDGSIRVNYVELLHQKEKGFYSRNSEQEAFEQVMWMMGTDKENLENTVIEHWLYPNYKMSNADIAEAKKLMNAFWGKGSGREALNDINESRTMAIMFLTKEELNYYTRLNTLEGKINVLSSVGNSALLSTSLGKEVLNRYGNWSQEMYAKMDSRYEPHESSNIYVVAANSKIQHPYGYAAGTLLGNYIGYKGAANVVGKIPGIKTGVAWTAGKLAKLPGLSAIGSGHIGNVLTGTMVDIGVDTLPMAITMKRDNESAREIAKSVVWNLGVNVVFNIGAEGLSALLNKLDSVEVKGEVEGTGNIKVQEVTPPGAKNPVEVYTDGHAQINKGKIETYIRGKVELDIDVAQTRIDELKAIQKQTPDIFDKSMKQELKSLNDQVHNYQRSQEMSKTLNNAGIIDTVENNQMITENLLEAAKQVSLENTEIISYLSGANGSVQVVSRWKILDDGTPYLATVILKPVK